MTKRPAFTPRGTWCGQELPKGRGPVPPAMAATSSIADSHSQVPLSVVSIHDYEALMAPREAFVDFLLRPQGVPRGREDAGPPALAV